MIFKEKKEINRWQLSFALAMAGILPLNCFSSTVDGNPISPKIESVSKIEEQNMISKQGINTQKKEMIINPKALEENNLRVKQWTPWILGGSFACLIIGVSRIIQSNPSSCSKKKGRTFKKSNS